MTINHRLNIFGYLYLDHLSDEYAGSSCAGMLDITLALQWVKDNIEGFGGDPGRVMIFGESGGGRKVSVMMALPSARGLFNRAVVQSGSALRMDLQHIAAERTEAVFRELELAQGDIRALQQLPMERLMLAATRAARSQFRPVIGTSGLPEHPFDPAASPLNADVPMMIGTCRTETSLFLGINPRVLSMDEAGLQAQIAGLVPEGETANVLAAYRRLYPDAERPELLYRISTDRGYFLDSTIQAERKAAQPGADAFYFTFNRHTPVENGRYITPHSSEIPFVFNNLEAGSNVGGEVTAESQRLADAVSGAWAAFARTGNPNHAGLADWPAYDSADRASMIFDEPDSHVVNDPRSEERLMMLGYGSQQYNEREPTPTGA